MPTKSRKPETIALHAGYRSDPATGAVAGHERKGQPTPEPSTRGDVDIT